ncbi:uncharacterized protein TCAP_04709 [Tolypocladium capitatum]|uniref:Uncharacterized protein n=1 Tax=Tolypocladium capitatum TaxID=45235 RepID=A0A2K3QCV3_9HYPO|nr:uncharacterized protein TCAP_04709 [Tolypocladium capitatum]
MSAPVFRRVDSQQCRSPVRIQDGMSSRSRQSSLERRKRASQSPSKRSATTNTRSAKSTGPYDRAFQQHLVDHHVFPDGYEYPDGRLPPEPENIDEILGALARPRASLSPSRFTTDDFRKFKQIPMHLRRERSRQLSFQS